MLHCTEPDDAFFMNEPHRRRYLRFAAASAAVGATSLAGTLRASTGAPVSPPKPAIPPAAAVTFSIQSAGVRDSGRRFVLNDASRLNPVPVHSHWTADLRDEAFFLGMLHGQLRSAASLRRPFVASGARHSMGGQSLPRDGHALTLAINICEPDTRSKVFRVHAGARWSQVIDKLDGIGFSPAVMQSNSDFSVGATFAVNAHGWPAPFGPFGSTVRAFRIMLADGTRVNCSRDENPDLFALSMGGYGLFGVLIDLDVEMVENQLLRPTRERLAGDAAGARFAKVIQSDRSVRMAYGRLSVARSGFLEDALLVTYRPVATDRPLPPAGTGGLFASVAREVFRAQIGSEPAKRARWIAETAINPSVGSGEATRNTLMNEPVANLAGRHANRTDILHEYFVSPEVFPAFLAACREVILGSRQELLNVTLRYVAPDPTSVLSYAPEPRIAAVMLFSQVMTPEGEADMLQMTEALIDHVLRIGGTYYLPYRLHARRDQFERSNPRHAEFAARKRHYDPGLLFRHALWDAYLSRPA